MEGQLRQLLSHAMCVIRGDLLKALEARYYKHGEEFQMAT